MTIRTEKKLPEALLYATLLFSPTYLVRFHIGAVPTNLFEVLVVMLGAVWVARYLKEKKFPALPWWWKPAVLILIGGTVSVFAAPPELWLKSFGVLKGFLLEPMFVGWIADDLFRSKLPTTNYQRPITNNQVPSAARYLVAAIILSASVVAVVALAAYIGFARDVFITWDGRLRGIFLSPNHLAMTMGPALVLAAGFFLFAENKKTRLVSVFFVLPLAASLILTQSLAGIASAFLMVIFLFFVKLLPYLPPTIYKLRRGLAILAVLFAVIVIVAVGMKNVTDPRSSFASRITVWRVSTELLKDQWLFGIGPGNFQKYYLAEQKNFSPYLEWAVPQPHNVFLAFWLQTGLLGLAGFMWLLVRVFKEVFRGFSPPTTYHLPSIKIAAALALAAILLHGLIDTPIWKNDLATVFFVLISCAGAARSKG